MHMTIFATKKYVGKVDSDQRAVMSHAEIKLGTLIQINVRIRSCAELKKGNKVFVVGQIRQRAGSGRLPERGFVSSARQATK
jgi:hypothetical protein